MLGAACLRDVFTGLFDLVLWPLGLITALLSPWRICTTCAKASEFLALLTDATHDRTFKSALKECWSEEEYARAKPFVAMFPWKTLQLCCGDDDEAWRRGDVSWEDEGWRDGWRVG